MVIRALRRNVCSRVVASANRGQTIASMHPRTQPRAPSPRVRLATPADIAALLHLDGEVFARDRMSRRSFRRFLTSPTAAVLVAVRRRRIIGSAVLLFRRYSTVARVYSLAVAPSSAGRGIGPAILAKAAKLARERQCAVLRLEVHERNQRAIACYRKSGFFQFGRYDRYYHDDGNALRFEKPVPRARRQIARKTRKC